MQRTAVGKVRMWVYDKPLSNTNTTVICILKTPLLWSWLSLCFQKHTNVLQPFVWLLPWRK